MSRKKKGSQSQKNFNTSPFRSLKGLCVEASPQSASPRRQKVPKAPLAADADQFDREMELLGVRPLEARSRPCAEFPSAPLPEPTKERCGSDEDVFLAALGEMDAHFHDDYDHETGNEAQDPQQPRRMRKVRRGQLLPEAQLDLHGLGRETARQKVEYFIDNAIFHGLRIVLIITGRGNHSENKPVLRTSIENYLTEEASEKVIEWGRAPQRLGGEGALVVFLRRRDHSAE